MNKLLKLTPLFLPAFIACNAGPASTPADSGPRTAPADTVIATAHQDVDPVCGMIRDSTWTDYTLHNGDSIWFCAAPEKKAFLANPQKYLAGEAAKH